MTAGVFSSDGTASFVFIDWASATSDVTYPSVVHLGNVQPLIGISKFDGDTYRIKVEKHTSVGRGVTVILFDTAAKLIGHTVELE